MLLAEDGTPTRIRLSHGSISLNSGISQKKDVVEIRILPGQNNPRNEERLRSIFQSGNTDGLELDISAYGGFRRRDADIGYLKSAYLGAFAKFGYSWIFGVNTDPIRSQIIDPTSDGFPNCRIVFSQVASDFAKLGFYFIEQPLVAILSSIPPYGILLPWPGGPSAIEISRWILAERAESTSGQFNFSQFAPWPRTSEFLFDEPRKT